MQWRHGEDGVVTVHQEAMSARARLFFIALALSACEPELNYCRGNNEEQCNVESGLDRCYWLDGLEGEGGCAAVCGLRGVR